MYQSLMKKLKQDVPVFVRYVPDTWEELISLYDPTADLEQEEVVVYNDVENANDALESGDMVVENEFHGKVEEETVEQQLAEALVPGLASKVDHPLVPQDVPLLRWGAQGAFVCNFPL